MKGSGIYTKVSEIRDALKLTDQDAQRMEQIIQKYPMSVTDYYLSLIDPDDPGTPYGRCAFPLWRRAVTRVCSIPAGRRTIR